MKSQKLSKLARRQKAVSTSERITQATGRSPEAVSSMSDLEILDVALGEGLAELATSVVGLVSIA